MRTARFLVLIVVIALLSSLDVGFTRAQAANGITSPRDNAQIQGVVLIEGTATTPSFARYELAFFKEFDPLGEWVVFATGSRPVVNGLLATWDTTVGRDAGAPFYRDGTYRLRLRVVRQDSNYDEYFVLGLSLMNEEVEATPTETDTPQPAAVPSPTATEAFLLPTALPTLTTFPTATPEPTVAGGGAEVVNRGPPQRPAGFLEGEFSVDQIKGGVWLGVKLSIAFFMLVIAYLIARTVLRKLLDTEPLWDTLRETVARARAWLSE